jgi:hypothetical protein
MIEVRRNDQQTWILLAYGEFVDAAMFLAADDVGRDEIKIRLTKQRRYQPRFGQTSSDSTCSPSNRNLLANFDALIEM